MEFTGLFVLAYWSGSSSLRWVGCELEDVARPLFRHRQCSASRSKLFEISVFSPIFTAGLRLVLLEMRQ